MRFSPPVFFSLLISLLSQPSGAQEPSVGEVFSKHQGNARKRIDWFYARRAFPHDTVQQGTLWRALRQVAAYPQRRTTALAWESIGPQPGTYGPEVLVSGRVAALAVHPYDPSTAYLGAANGGIWKTTDGGASWVPKTDALSCLSTGSLVIDSRNPETIYWGTGEPCDAVDAYGGAGIFKSVDGGTTWFSSGLTQEKRICQMAIDGGLLVYAATWGGVYRSTNAGATWTRTLASGRAYDVMVEPVTSRVFAGIGDNSAAAGIYQSTDLGVHWMKLGGELPPSISINRIRFAQGGRFYYPTMYALMSGRSPFGGLLGLYKSMNGGTWTAVSAPADLFGPNNQGWYDIALSVNPEDGRRAYIGGFDTYRTYDGGLTWALRNGNGTVHFDQQDIDVSTWESVVYVGNDGGVWKTTDTGASWINLNSTLSLTQFYSVGLDRMNPGRIFGGTQDNGTQRSTGGPSWSASLLGDGGMVVVDRSRSDIVYAERPNGVLYRSIDSGNTFSPLHTVGGSWITPLRQHPVFPAVLFSANRQVLRSTDSGESWEAISGALNGNIAIDWIAISPLDTPVMYASSTNHVYRTSDGGSSWSDVSAGLPNLFVTQVVADPNVSAVVYVTFSGTGPSHVYRSIDRGVQWQSIGGDLPDIGVNTLLVEPGNSDHLYLGTDIGLFISSNGGISWAKDTGIPSSAVIDLDLTSNSSLVAATHGRGMFRAPISTPASVRLQIPDGGEVWQEDSTREVHWATNNVSDNVQIELSRDGGISFPEVLFAQTANDGVEPWSVSGPATRQARIRVSAVACPGVIDVSTADFAILRSVHQELRGGWNLVSIPVTVPDLARNTLFPSSSSWAYAFSGQMYVARDPLQYGEGYWLKFPSAQSVVLSGLDRPEDSLVVAAGWNIIGSLSHPAPVASIIELPPGIVLSNFFGYNGSYVPVDTLLPGKGYWVKMSRPGRLVIR